MATKDDPPNLRDMRVVRSISPGFYPSNREPLVNDPLQLGWVLLAVSSHEGGPAFVLGWTREGEAPKSRHDDRDEQGP